MTQPGHPSATGEALDALHDLVLMADAAGVQPARLERAVRRWSRDVASPAEAVVLAGAVRPRLGRGASRQRLLDAVTQYAVEAIAERQLAEALVDPLTGLATRTRMEDETEHLLALERRTGGVLSVVVLDVDGLKQINDEQGHAAGDAALAEVGRAVREHLRRADRAFRWGGDEFLLVLPGTPAHEAGLVVDRIRSSCATSVSVGVACSADLPRDADLAALLDAADTDLYSRRGAVRRVHVPRPRRLPFVGSTGLLVLALGAGLVGWTGATLAGSTFGSAPTSRPSTQALTPVHVPVAQAPQVTDDAPVAVATRATRSRAAVVRVHPAPAPAPALVPPVTLPVVPTLPPLPDAPPPAPGTGGLVGGALDTVKDLLDRLL